GGSSPVSVSVSLSVSVSSPGSLVVSVVDDSVASADGSSGPLHAARVARRVTAVVQRMGASSLVLAGSGRCRVLARQTGYDGPLELMIRATSIPSTVAIALSLVACNRSRPIESATRVPAPASEPDDATPT